MPPTAGTVEVTCSGVAASQKVHVKSATALPFVSLKAPAAICIVLVPATTGVPLKWKVICVLPAPKVGATFDGVPFTEKSLAWTVAVLTAALRLITKSTGCVLITLLQAGTLLVTPKPPCTKLTKTSCCYWLLMITLPSVQPPTNCVPNELW